MVQTQALKTFYSQRVSRLCEHTLSLLVVFFMLSAAALWTGKYFGHEIGTSAKGEDKTALALPTAQQLLALGLDEEKTSLAQRDSASWRVTLKANGAAAGTLISSQPYARDVKGFAGPVPLFVYIDEAGKVAGIAAGDNAETPDFLRHALDGLTPQWIGQDASKAAAAKVDAVSGATFSSNAVIAGVQRSLAAYGAGSAKAKSGPVIGWWRTLAVFFVLLTGVAINMLFRGHKWLRIIQLSLNVAVLGFWCGQFLSLSLLRGWIANGLDPVAYLPTLLMLAVALVMPLVKHKRHYCTWVCPMGSLQELAGRLPFPKIHCSAKVYRAMSRIRLGAFSLLMLSLWTGLGGFLLDYEPFTAFLTSTALPAVIIMAAVIIVASCFVPNVWCKCLCPMGMALDLSEDSVKKSSAAGKGRK